jgi:hypothetical protein
MRRLKAAALIWAQLTASIFIAETTTTIPARASTLCATPGNDGVGSPNGIVNTYFPPASSSQSVPAGATSVSLGSHAVGDAAVPIASGDLILILQVQDATISTSNSIAYGDGSTGTGATSLGATGAYEYVVATDSVSTAGGTLTFEGVGTDAGTLNTYTEAPANAFDGQETFEVVRVPQYSTATLGSGFTALAWNGATGGVAVIDVEGVLTLNSATPTVAGEGMRGGGRMVGAGAAGDANTDYAASSSLAADGSKGEGAAGTPLFTFDGTTQLSSGSDYPGGGMARGAPANAGGGATDDDPANNDKNSGGGGGANGGKGGVGGDSDSTVAVVGGLGGSSLGTASGSIVTMGGGGGAGSSNLGTQSPNGSSGGTGGGILLARVGGTSGTATFDAGGGSGQGADTDGGGGGGAGGTIIVSSPNALTGVTIQAVGGTGGSTATTLSGNANRYGPGGGGGGGFVMSTTAPAAHSQGGGVKGTTLSSLVAYGAVNGSGGSYKKIASTDIPGVLSGAECPVSGSGANTLYVGPYDVSDATYHGAAYTGSYDGVLAANNNNEFTAASIPLVGIATINSGTVPGTVVGNAVTLGSTEIVDVPNEFYDDQTGGTRRTVTVAATAPTGWTAQICRDSGGIACGTYDTNHALCNNNAYDGWNNTMPTAPAATSTGTFCVPATNGVYMEKFWVEYTVPTSLTTFTRYDASILAQDNQTIPASNVSHNELYAGFVALTKTATIIASGCPAGENPGYSSGICPSGVLKYSIDYRNIMAGGGTGTEVAAASSLYLTTPAGSLSIGDNGTGAGNSWGTNSNGLTVGLTVASSFPNCGVLVPLGACGDTTTGSIFSYDAGHPSGVGATSVADQVGGPTFQLYPIGVAGQTGQGTLVFAIQIK